MIEGEFGTGKRAYGLNRIMAHLRETSFCVIGVALLCMNLTKRLRSLCLDLFAGLMQILCSMDRLSALLGFWVVAEQTLHYRGFVGWLKYSFPF